MKSPSDRRRPLPPSRSHPAAHREREVVARPRSRPVAFRAGRDGTESSLASDLLAISAEAISRADADHPADQVLRTVLKSRRDLEARHREQVVRATFSFFRWRGWIDKRRPLLQQIAFALDLAERFAHQAESFSDAELEHRAIPAWTRQELSLTPDWVRSLQAEPKLWLRARPGQGPALANQLGRCRAFGAGSLSDTLEYSGRDDLFRTAAFHAGEFEVQDLSSQAVGLICTARPGETWWDACAGEGGKTLHLSDLMENKGLIWATDRTAWRLQHLRRRAARAKVFNYRTALWAETSVLPTKTRFDGVLVDAPCSGLGTWQRNPHARWTTTPRDIQELAVLQADLLHHATRAVKVGGKLVYSVCTLTRAETTDLADRFDREFTDFTPVAVQNPFEPERTPSTRLFLWPQEFGGNGMFVAVWERRKV